MMIKAHEMTLEEAKHILETTKLNERQKRLADYYLQTCNGAEAVKMAGYSKENSNKAAFILLNRPKMRRYLTARMKVLESERIAKVEEIQQYLTAVMRGETEEEVAMNVGTGKGLTKVEVVKVKASAKERIKAAELMGKVHGMFMNKQEIDLSGSLPVVIKDDI